MDDPTVLAASVYADALYRLRSENAQLRAVAVAAQALLAADDDSNHAAAVEAWDALRTSLGLLEGVEGT